MPEQRREEQRAAALPIFACRDEFCARLRKERVLVVTANTGSGKTTQLPQYCADDDVLGKGLVACTQPRVMAAISISKRIAEEHDGVGVSVGESVGYSVGGGQRVAGRKIALMTDAALIRDLKDDPLLRKYSVLIIDEAHERSLNTDISLGVAKLVLQQRPDDFYVVIASATIDPKEFLAFFGIQRHAPLSVPGRY
jgi:ATP-dependent helicase HrpA